MSRRHGKVNRFIVFRAVQAFMNQWNRCPQPSEVAAITGIPSDICARHMHAIDGATGLKHPVKYDTNSAYSTRGFIVGGSGNRRSDPYTTPVDRLMA